MKILHEVYDFIAGGSILAPIGLAIAILGVIVMGRGTVTPYVFVALIVLTLAAATREKIA